MAFITLARRRVVITAVAGLLVLCMSGVANAAVPPEQQTGAIGGYYIKDSGSTVGVTCWYQETSPNHHKLDHFTFKAPTATWPDQDAGNPNEHGKVAFSVWIQQANQPNVGPWSAVFKSSEQKTTIYESDGYRSLGTKTVSWHSSQDVYFRAIVWLRWIKPNGNTKGTLKHWMDNYLIRGSVAYMVPSVGTCPNKTMTF